MASDNGNLMDNDKLRGLLLAGARLRERELEASKIEIDDQLIEVRELIKLLQNPNKTISVPSVPDPDLFEDPNRPPGALARSTNGKPHSNRYTDAFKKRIVAEVKASNSFAVATKHGLVWSTVNNWVRQARQQAKR